MRLLIGLLFAAALAAQTTTGGLTPKGALDASGATTTKPSKSGTSLPGTCSTGESYFKTDATAGLNSYLCTATNTWTPVAPHVVTFNLGDGTNVITTGDAKLYRSSGPYSGTINSVDVTGFAAALATCSITVDVWKLNAAFPTNANKISASAPAALSSANAAQGTLDISTWTKAVAAKDIWNVSVASITGCVSATVEVFFQ